MSVTIEINDFVKALSDNQLAIWAYNSRKAELDRAEERKDSIIVSAKELAEFCGKSVGTVKNWRSGGWIENISETAHLRFKLVESVTRLCYTGFVSEDIFRKLKTIEL